VVCFGFHFDNLLTHPAVYLSALVSFCLLISTYLFVAFTKIGLTPDKAYWGEPGVPLLGWQLALAILTGFLVFLIGLRARSQSRLDLIVPPALWLLAVAIWLSIPISVMQNSFYAPINPPSGQPFPNSDAGYYDSMSQSILIGYPYFGDIPTRPLYIVFLSLMHLLAGEHYDIIIAGQTLILALIPVALYFLGYKMHSRTAGVIIALFAIFREWTSLLISSQTRVSNTKTLLVDLPTFLLLLLACLFVLRWLERKDWQNGLIAGGFFGILLLLRTQSMLILPVLFILVILVYGLRSRGWAIAIAFFMLGFIVTITPWLLHNYLNSGKITFDAPFEYKVIASQYQYTGNLEIQNMDLQGKGLLGILLTFILKDPIFVFGFMASHFFATQIHGILALPLIEKYNGLFAPVYLYWMSWDGGLGLLNSLLIIFYLAVIALGLGSVWRRLRWVGLIPLAFSLGYAIANGVGRFSGWRYDLPADWVSFFYFGIGLAELFILLALLFNVRSGSLLSSTFTDQSSVANQSHVPLFVVAFIGVFALVGGLPWLVKGLAAPRYEGQTPSILITRLTDSSAVQVLGVNRAQIEDFVASPQATLKIGRVLYPRFFSRNQGLASTNPWPAYAPRDYPRLGFVFINQSLSNAVLPSREVPIPFPSAADAIVLGCQRTDFVEIRLILFPDLNITYLSSPLILPCN
jgi:hypothetical protein